MAKAKYDPNTIMVQKKKPLKPGDPGFVMEVDRALSPSPPAELPKFGGGYHPIDDRPMSRPLVSKTESGMPQWNGRLQSDPSGKGYTLTTRPENPAAPYRVDPEYNAAMNENWAKKPFFVNGQGADPVPPSAAIPVSPPPRPQGSFGQMGNARMADRGLPQTQSELPPPPKPTPQPQSQPTGSLDPLPFNDRKARERARGDYARALHSDSQGLSPMDREARIQMIRDREDVRDAYARANRTVQRVQQPGEQTGRYNELRGQMFGQFNKELEDLTAQRAALDKEPLSDDVLNRRSVADAAIAAKRAQIEKAVGNWSDLTPEQAAARTAGQERLAGRQQADRASGAADVTAYQNREKYFRAQEDQIRQAEFDRQRAALGAETAQSQAVIDNRGQTPQDRVAALAATEAERAAKRQQAIDDALNPTEDKLIVTDTLKQANPQWQGAASGIINGIKALSGKGWSGSSSNASSALAEGVGLFNTLPDELKDNVAITIMNELAGSGLSLPKDAYQDDTWSGFLNTLGRVMQYTTPTGLAATAAGYTPFSKDRASTEEQQRMVNEALEMLRGRGR